ncbi:carbohydrate ABC transporter permease [Cryobacterium sp. MDB1-18-2]|uniref:carbohydrate ABC transporter permease n=1 Tax=unclassified Cryobacterium TaxID=2649013 RepID=UPI00106C0A1B|nr:MULTISPECIES: carbohydrate ABC transporter permease [unclassified Cryobacterium]TFC35995.1 carbohydrate ABC transporter permease [Cryobacterium sp. MDB1-18-2]TFC41615.1 carbohydrate ABC transporter permease [Cryobacterium sp. MDB1-18-1]
MTVLVSTTSPRPEKRRSHASREASRAGGRRVLPHLVLVGLILYFALPFWWLIVASTKDQATLFSGDTSPLWFGKFNLIDNIQQLFTYSNGLYWHWLGNSFLYALTGGIGATVISVLAGYGFAQYRFAGRTPFFALVLGSVMVPATALVIPMFVMFSATHLTNTMWAVILPSMLNPFGVYLMRVYTQDAIPDEMIDAARMDGAGELRIFFRVALPLLRPALVTVLLLSVVGTWNNYFLPLVMFSNPNLFPVTVGLGALQTQAGVNTGGQSLWTIVIVGALVSVIPLIIAFLTLQKYWQGGLSLGSVK